MGENNTIKFDFKGEKFLEIMDQMFEDTEWLREEIKNVGDVTQHGPSNQAKINEKLFGIRGPIRVISGGEMSPLFDYEEEVALARETQKKLLDKLGIMEKIPVDFGQAGEFKVGGVRLIYTSDMNNNVRPFNYDAGYSLSVIGWPY